MRDFAQQAVIALTAYLERGEAALNLLSEKRYDEAMEVLQKRTAAFHNFRVADSLAKSESPDGIEPVEELLRSLWNKIELVNNKLKEALENARGETLTDLTKISQSRQKLSRYRSGYVEKRNFEQSV